MALIRYSLPLSRFVFPSIISNRGFATAPAPAPASSAVEHTTSNAQEQNVLANTSPYKNAPSKFYGDSNVEVALAR
ncbi:unnamed protein product, partial [Rotaria magnacalcarata]